MPNSVPTSVGRYSLDDLLYLMSRLRDPDNGCPWDLKQTPNTIINYSIEEIYELADAIEADNTEEVKAELGDVLFQVIFLSQLANEQQQFAFNDVVHGICSKLVTRHPHIFSDGYLYPQSSNAVLSNTSVAASDSDTVSAEAVGKSWEQIKAAERANKNLHGLFDDVPLALPAILRAAKLQKRAANIGFDWSDVKGALSKLKEEVNELEALIADYENINTENAELKMPAVMTQRIQEELGDVLFSVVNVARKSGIQGEQALRQANNKFIARVNAVLEKQGGFERMGQQKVDSDTLDKLWEQVKQDGL